jgi:hypothetical protein
MHGRRPSAKADDGMKNARVKALAFSYAKG